MKTARTSFFAAVLTMLVLPMAQAAAEYKDQVIDYTVIAGDTIQGITRRTLGTDTFWQANWALNPEVADPNVLRIGQKLRIIQTREIIAERARVELAVNEIEKQLKAKPWSKAAIGDQISDGEAIRTRAKSSAVLRFNANSVLRLGEFSQVYLAKKETTLAGVDRGSVEVTEGDVDLVFEKMSGAKTDLEIISGNSSVRAAADATGNATVRAGVAAGGGTRVMVFSGASEVKAAGSAVNVGAGMGTKVPVSGPPQAPEKLLAAPKLVAEAMRWSYNNGLIRWVAVPKAVAYTLEVCADLKCDTLALRKTGIKPSGDGTNQFQVADLIAQTYFVRVSAESATGLDGYPSQLGSLQIDRAVPDTTAPMLSLQPSSGFAQLENGAWFAGPEARAFVTAFDELSGLDTLQYRFDENAFQSIELGAEIPVHQGQLEIKATDQLGQAQQVRYQIGSH